MAEIYIVIVSDRHDDTEVYPFTSPGKAISEAKRIARNSCRHPDDYEEKKYEGWLFFANYSCEGDHVRVVTSSLNEEGEHHVLA
jgi:hypothetical protein